MDKKIDEELLDRPVDIRLKLNRQTAPDGETYYRANVQHRPTLDEQDLARRVADKRSEMRPETLLYAYRCLKEEIYEALLNGHSVDLGFGLLTLRVQGRFEHPADRFDPARHAFNVAFTPAPRLLQLEKSLTAQSPSTQTADRRPVILEANSDNPARPPEGYTYGRVRAGSEWVYLSGRDLKIMGDHPDNGLSFRNDGTGETIAPKLLAINQRNLLFACLERPLTPGTWTVSLATQFNRTYHLYKTPRHASFTFEVTE